MQNEMITETEEKLHKDDAHGTVTAAAAAERTELNCHTLMSLGQGIASAEEYMTAALDMGMDAIAITDFWNVQAYPDAYRRQEKLSSRIKAIYGMEVVFEGRQTMERAAFFSAPIQTISILAKNKAGIINIYALITGFRDNRDRYSMDKGPAALGEISISEHREGLMIGSGNWQDIVHDEMIGSGLTPEDLAENARFFDYLEVHPNHGSLTEEEFRESVCFMIRLGEISGKPVVATGESGYLYSEDRKCFDVLCHEEGSAALHSAKRYLMTTDEMLREFAFLGEEKARGIVIANSRAIAAMTDVMRPVPERYCPPVITDADRILEEACLKRINEIYTKGIPKEARSRLDDELAKIRKHGYASFYVTGMKLAAKSREMGYPVMLGGSGAGSFAAFLSGITDINPLPAHYYCPECGDYEFVNDIHAIGADLEEKQCGCGCMMERYGYSIPVEPFVAFNGEREPDFDFNFASECQPYMIEYLKELFGKDRIIRPGTIGRMSQDEISTRIEDYCKTKDAKLSDLERQRIEDTGYELKGECGIHPGGVFIIPDGTDILEFTPLEYVAGIKEAVTHLSYHALYHNFYKLDCLKHYGMTMLYMLKRLTGEELRYGREYRQEILELFRNTYEKAEGSSLGTLGLPEFGSHRVMKIIEQARPDSIEDIIRICSISHGTDAWTGNAEKLIKNETASFKEVITCREDIYYYLLSKGISREMAYEIMETVRKGKFRNGRSHKWKYLRALMETQGIPEWYIDSCMRIWYLFPKAHCASHTLMSLSIALYKIYHPEEFYAVYAMVRSDTFKKLVMNNAVSAKYELTETDCLEEDADLIKEMMQRHIDINKVRNIIRRYHRKG